MANNKKKKINIRKYINYVLLVIAIVLIGFISIKLYDVYKTNQLNTSVLTRIVGSIKYEDVDNTKKELASEDFIFISYLKSVEVRELENKMKKTIINNDLQNNFYYLDATDLMLEENYINDLNKKFNLKGENKIIELPALLYYRSGEFIKTITSTEESIMKINDFNKLIESYEITKK